MWGWSSLAQKQFPVPFPRSFRYVWKTFTSTLIFMPLISSARLHVQRSHCSSDLFILFSSKWTFLEGWECNKVWLNFRVAGSKKQLFPWFFFLAEFILGHHFGNVLYPVRPILGHFWYFLWNRRLLFALLSHLWHREPWVKACSVRDCA